MNFIIFLLIDILKEKLTAKRFINALHALKKFSGHFFVRRHNCRRLVELSIWPVFRVDRRFKLTPFQMNFVLSFTKN